MSDLKCSRCGTVTTYADAYITDSLECGCGYDDQCNWKEV
jgi:hypothetical protein